MKKKLITCALLLGISVIDSYSQEKLYPNTFPLSDVKLLDGPFKHACDLNVQTLLSYDVDRLLAPYLKEAGLPPKGESFSCWEGLDGHVGGHYLSALAIHYAATGDVDCKNRMDYMLAELKRCQQANGNGYLGGVPNGRPLWEEVHKGNVAIVWKYWVPWYNVHKMYAGLRDAWLYGGSEEAKQMFLDFCDWGYEVISALTAEQMEQMLANEFGGMDEIYADAYGMAGDAKYLAVAKRFSHRILFDSMAAEVDNLDNMHANTQVPKAVGYQRIAELSHDSLYLTASSFFWNTVVNNRSLAFGGNSRREHFPAADDCKSYVSDREGPESCNTYNMLRLTEGLFRISPEARYADYYERAMFNHILSTQHPEHGGYVYFTPARPCHYRVYSASNSAMWCCVGTGMENHGKYGEFIYTHSHDSLFVNLFVASQLTWREKGMTITQHTEFPNSESSRISVQVAAPERFKMLVRRPWWASDMKIICQGVDYAKGSSPMSYVVIDREWKNGDEVEIQMPMRITLEEMPNVPDYVAIMRGPILMAAKTGAENVDGLVADDSRMAHIAAGALVPTYDAPMLQGSRKHVLAQLNKMKPVEGEQFSYYAPKCVTSEKYQNLKLEPFYRVHDCRYVIYWKLENGNHKQSAKEEERKRILLDKRTVDVILTGEQQPEADHYMQSQNSFTGVSHGETWREARENGFLQYKMSTQGLEELTLMVRYWGNEENGHTFDIYIDNQILTTEDNAAWKWRREDFVNVEYRIPGELLKSKQSVTVTFKPKPENKTGGIYCIRLLK